MEIKPTQKFKFIKDVTFKYYGKDITLPKGLVITIVSVHLTYKSKKVIITPIKNKKIIHLFYEGIDSKIYNRCGMQLLNNHIELVLNELNVRDFTSEYDYFSQK